MQVLWQWTSANISTLCELTAQELMAKNTSWYWQSQWLWVISKYSPGASYYRTILLKTNRQDKQITVHIYHTKGKKLSVRTVLVQDLLSTMGRVRIQSNQTMCPRDCLAVHQLVLYAVIWVTFTFRFYTISLLLSASITLGLRLKAPSTWWETALKKEVGQCLWQHLVLSRLANMQSDRLESPLFKCSRGRTLSGMQVMHIIWFLFSTLHNISDLHYYNDQ